MTELKNVERELSRFRGRVIAAAVFVLLGFGLLCARLVHLQVNKHAELATQAEANRIAVLPIVPNRGLIVDRNGVVLATNYSAYTLEIAPLLVRDVDATIDELSKMVEISTRDRKRFRKLMAEGKTLDSLPLRSKLTDDEVARVLAQRWRFPGVDVRARLFRHYPLGETGSHLIGYIGRINQSEKEAMEDWEDEVQANYRGTDYIGKLGIEQRYESELHGTTGFEEVETSAGGRAVRRLKSHAATPGNTLALSIDIRMQALVEEMFGERRGALVAIDPRNGEVLALVSKPAFDPNLFVDGIDSESWKDLNESIDKPLLNRALRGTYPPGSTFKPFMAIAALTSGVRGPNEIIQDNGFYQFGNHRFRSHGDHGLGAVDMYKSIVKSSNVYYYSLANEMGVDRMHEYLSPYSFGRRTGIDLDGELTGVLPSTAWKKKAYRKRELQQWYAGETISLGIGQGYNNFTMLQIANAMATLVAGGQRFEPRLVRDVQSMATQARTRVSGQLIEPIKLDPAHVAIVMRAMHGVTQEGTSTRVFAGAPYKSGGKTGTAQAVTIKQNEKYNASKLDEHQRDHSLYIAFAPLEAPTIALAVIVENAGFGAAAAAPIARRVFDYALQGQWPSEADMTATRAGTSAAPSGTPRRAADIPLPGQQPLEAMAAARAVPTAPAAAAPPVAVAPSTAKAPATAQGKGSGTAQQARASATTAAATAASTPAKAPAEPPVRAQPPPATPAAAAAASPRVAPTKTAAR